ncbi:CHAP domain-containing protein [Cellulomonas sp. PhB150]|uniref:CHAP domain-containing protein n=1 Tax=Cellulomonas sp. PhB150 TaxID=2485188 RepID=UPI000F48AFDC|nr:CHAP domain-containing protein [Cellulomonas sp. PhB150]ROS31224.1 CHAP domain-containing protein [Cellulomonas sp. PhB150]
MRRLVTAAGCVLALAVTGLVGAMPAAAATVVITSKVSASTFRIGEGLWFTGHVKKNGKAVPRTTVQLVKIPTSGRKVLVTSARTSATGGFSIPAAPDASARYYVRTSGTGAVRGKDLPVKRTSAGQTLENRAQLLGSRLGAATSSLKRLSSGKVAKVGDTTVTSVRYRAYAKGTLVEVVRAGTKRTWFVPGKIRTRYAATGGPTGTFGVPRRDARCVVLESGCVQQFSKVAAYQNATKSKAFYQAGSSRRAEYLATARSQVGYKEPSWRGSKYNTWIGAKEAWCGTFQAWVAAAAGNPGAVPARTTFPGFVAAVKNRLTTFSPRSKTHKPHAGTLVFFDFRNASPKKASHVGVLISRSGGTVTVLEGNASSGSRFTDKRGVYVHTRPASKILFYAEPDW